MTTIAFKSAVKNFCSSCWLTIASLCVAATLAGAADAPLVAQPPIVVPDSKGGFDYLQVDDAQRRLLCNHTGNGSLDVFNADTGVLIKHIAVGAAQGVAIDVKGGKYIVSVSREKKAVIIDSKTLAILSEVKLAGPGDAIEHDPKNDCVYIGHDDAPGIFVVNVKSGKVVTTITIPEGPEYILYDAGSDRVYVNIKSSDEMLVIDPASNTVKEHWPTAPAKRPHGLAFNPKTQRFFSAGANGKLAVIDAKTGKVITSVDIAPGIDQIAFDADKKRIYCASSTGVISVVEETADGAISLGNVKTAKGAKTVAVDPKTHAVWVAYGEAGQSFIRKLTLP